MNKPTGSALADLQRRLAQVEQQLARVTLEQELLATQHRYCHAIDYGPIDKLDDVFTQDAEFDILTNDGKPNRNFVRKVGIAELKRYFQWRLEAQFIEQRYKHLVFSPVTVSVKGDEARVESYFAAFLQAENRPVLRVYGRYKDWLVKRNGRWLIRERQSWQESPSAVARGPGETGIDPTPSDYVLH